MENKSFVEMLKLGEIIEILKRNNLQLKMNLPQPLLRDVDENGNHVIIAKCEHIEQTAEGKLEDMIGGAIFGGLNFGSEFAESAKMYSAYNGIEIIEIADFYMVESMSLKSDEEAGEYAQQLTDVYHEYMTNKFGEEYVKAAKAYFKKIRENNAENNGDLQK